MIKRLLHELKEYKRASLLAPLCVCGEVIMELMIPFLMSYIIDRGVNAGDIEAIVKYGLMMLVCAFAALFFGAMSGHYSALAAAGFIKNVRDAMFKKIQTFSFANVDRFSTSGLVTRMMTDASNVQQAYQMIIRLGVRAPLILVVAIGMTLYINARLAVIFLIAMVFLAVVLSLITLKSYPLFQKTFQKYDDLNESVQENVGNIRVVKAYVKEEHEISRFDRAVENLKRMFTKAENILVFNSPVMTLTVNACMIALSWFGAQFVVSGQLATGELMSMFTYNMNILMSLMILSMIFVMLSMSLASAKRISEILVEQPTIANPDHPIMEVEDGSIQFRAVSFSYSDTAESEVLHSVDLSIASGETIGILGSTGSSKTTLTNLIPRLYDVSAGAVLVGNRDVREYDLRVLRDSVSVVLQKNVLFSGTIIENMRWGNDQATLEDIQAACKLACADEFIQQFPDKYETFIEQGGTNVSGGQKQRLCIARSLLKHPKVLILDDSTSAVDTRTDAQIRESFRTSLKETTTIIVSQRISSIEDADRILVMEDGRISSIGTHAELLKTSAIYQDVYETQKRGDEE